jgi:hypothetical protein
MMDGVMLTACKWYDILSTCGLYYKNILMIVSDDHKGRLYYKCASPYPYSLS